MACSWIYMCLRGVIGICCCLLPVVSMASDRCDTLSACYVGNWVNKTSNVWEYGLYEQFAIFDTDFWEYKEIDYGKRKITVVLEKDGVEKVLYLHHRQGESLEIAQEKGKPVAYSLAKKGFVPYPDRDTTSFPVYRYANDSVTILGYYRHWEQLPGELRSRVIDFARNDCLMDKEVKVGADVDSCGRFRVRVPVTGLEKIFLDWRFMGKSAHMVPGEKLLVYADAADLLKRLKVATSEDYWNYVSDVLFMGENARFHTEMSHCPSTMNIRGYSDFAKKELSDMEILKETEGDYLGCVKVFDGYVERYPTLSRKCVSMFRESMLYLFAHNLMQNRFRFFMKKRLAFEPGYMEFVQSKFPLDCEWFYQADYTFQGFMKHYLDYLEAINDRFEPDGTRCSLAPVQPSDILAYVRSNNLADTGIISLIDNYNRQLEEAEANTGTISLPGNYNQAKADTVGVTLFDRISAYLETPAAKEVGWLLNARYVKARLDSLLPSHSHLKELQLGSYFMGVLERTHVPFSAKGIEWIRENIKNQSIRERVYGISDFYQKIAGKEITWQESLKSSEHLKEYDDAKALFRKLTEPYKGSVVYLDIWGTWCGPCREQMAYVKDIKEALKGEKVIYMYLANRSDENTWKNLIREYDLSGENVVHYRLPEKQQRMLERLLEVAYFPTFILLDKEGNIANPKAPRPQDKEKLVREIQKLLED